jgi:hypothetical protein
MWNEQGMHSQHARKAGRREEPLQANHSNFIATMMAISSRLWSVSVLYQYALSTWDG